MSESFKLEIISPDAVVIKSEANEVSIPAYEGQITILKDHISLLTFLRPGFISVNQDKVIETFFIEEGTVEFSKNNLLILSSTAINIKDLKESTKEKIIKESKDLLNDSKITDKDRYVLSYKVDTLQQINK